MFEFLFPELYFHVSCIGCWKNSFGPYLSNMTMHLHNACGTVSRSPEWAAGLFRGTFAGYRFRAETLQSVSTRALYGCIYNPGWDKKGCATTVEYGSGSLISKVNPGFGENMPFCIQNDFTRAFLWLDKDAIAVFICSDNEHVSTSCLQYVFHITRTHKNQHVCIVQANLPG